MNLLRYSVRCSAGFLSLAFLLFFNVALGQTAPSVTTDPVQLDLATGATLQLAPTLAGDAPTACQWFKDGVAIEGATGTSYTVNSASAATAGYYTAKFENATGSTLAAIALVRIDGAAAAPDTSAKSYQLSDYYYPRSEGSEWLYSGLDSATHSVVHTRVRMADLDRAVTSYTGRYAPMPVAATTLAVEGAYGAYSGGVFTASKQWTDYVTADGSGVAMWGDDYVGGESVRLDGPYRFPPSMRLGQTCSRLADYYEHGQFVCPVELFLQLLSVDTVETPAGRFHGAIHLRIVLLAPGNTRMWEEWWVAGYGKVRNLWLSGSGLRADSRLVSVTIPTTTRYTLADYFAPRLAGLTANYVGTNWSGFPARIGTRVASLAQNITSYTGTLPPIPTTVPVLALERSSTRTDVAGAVTDTWFEYYSTPSNVLFWGIDDDPGTSEIRFENGMAMPATMIPGDTVTASRNAYHAGGGMVLPVGTASFQTQFIGVESVTVPAGTFPAALRLRFTLSYAGSTEVHDEWLVAGIGGVRYRMVSGASQLSGDLVDWVCPSVPTISDQPKRVTCDYNGTASLSVLAAGTGPLTFEWYSGESGDTANKIAGESNQTYTTPALTAWRRYWVRVSNDYGSVDSATILVMPNGGTKQIADWTLLDDIPNNQRGALNTPAGDGVSNLMKFALGVTPMGAAMASQPRAVVVTASGSERHFALEFPSNIGALGIRYVLETSADLVAWNEVSSTLTVLGSRADGRQDVRLTETLALEAGAARRFARLKIAAP